MLMACKLTSCQTLCGVLLFLLFCYRTDGDHSARRKTGISGLPACATRTNRTKNTKKTASILLLVSVRLLFVWRSLSIYGRSLLIFFFVRFKVPRCPTRSLLSTLPSDPSRWSFTPMTCPSLPVRLIPSEQFLFSSLTYFRFFSVSIAVRQLH